MSPAKARGELCCCPHPSRSAPASPKPCSARSAPARGGGGELAAQRRRIAKAAAACAALSLACSAATPANVAPASVEAASTAGRAEPPSSACALTGSPEGWASVAPGDAAGATPGAATTGGAAADAAHIFHVRTRAELVRALSPDAVFAPDGSFTSERGPDPTPKSIHVHGTISLNTDAAGVERTEADYACPGYDFARYLTEADPRIHNRQPLVDGKPPELTECAAGKPTQEGLRECSSRRQRRIVMVHVGSNTSLLGVGTDARIVHGTLAIAPPPDPTDPAADPPDCAAAAGHRAPPSSSRPGPDNVIVQNLHFSDAFDFFPGWDPRDAYERPPAVADPASAHPRCQQTLDGARDAGPHQCPGGRWNSAYDNVAVLRARHVWIDHSTFDDGERDDTLFPSVWAAPYASPSFMLQHHDGLLDITGNSDFVTVSYNVFRNHDKTTLVGGSDAPRPENGLGALSVSFHHNRYENAGQRMPRVRFGKVHIYDNFVAGALLPREEREGAPLVHGISYGMGIGYLAKIYAENNVYELRSLPGEPAPDESALYELLHKAAPTGSGSPDSGQHTYFYARGNILNGEEVDLLSHANAAAARHRPPRPPLVSADEYWQPARSYEYVLSPSAEVKAEVLGKAGVCRGGNAP
jgi:pectate lyase